MKQKPKYSQLKLWPRREYGVSSIPGIREGYHFYEDGKLNQAGKVYYQFATAARILNVPRPRLMYWVNRGFGPDGISMNIYVHTNYRRMLPEETVLALQNSLAKKCVKTKIKSAPHP